MKRSTIKNSTYGIIIFCIFIFIVISILPSLSRHKAATSLKTQEGKELSWADTISNHQSSPEIQEMERHVENFMRRWNLRGMQIAVSRNDSLLYTRGFGFADVEKNKPMQANSTMRIASSSKLITGAAIAKLIEAGKLSLTDTVFGENGILDNKNFTDAIRDRRILSITVKDLLHHAGGFTLGAGDPMFNTNEIIKVKKLDNAPSKEKLIEIVLGRRLGFQPGSGHRYSNFGYFLLSMIIEKISGNSYWDFVNENLFKPAGIRKIKPATNYYSEKYPEEVKYYAPDDELIEEFNGSGRMVERTYGGTDIKSLMGAGGWVASAAELSRFVVSIDGDGRFKDVISRRSVEMMTDNDGEKFCGFGWTKADCKGNWMRSGTLASAHSLIQRFPDGECWVITMNTGVWRGYHFTRELQNLVNRCRANYSRFMPRRNLF